MTKEELWKIYCEKNPSFNRQTPDNIITMTARGLKKLCEQTWKIAEEESKKKNNKPYKNNDFMKSFEDLFGKKY